MLFDTFSSERSADTNEEHLDLKKKNYTHTSPAKCWKGYERVPGTKKNAKGSCKKK